MNEIRDLLHYIAKSNVSQRPPFRALEAIPKVLKFEQEIIRQIKTKLYIHLSFIAYSPLNA
jgi:hypothetical protein